MAEHNRLGQEGESLAVDFLTQKNYNILVLNFRHQRAEIDIIACYDNVLVVVEVKTRSSSMIETPKSAVTLTKQKHLIRAADAYIQENNIELECRFDIIGVILEKGEANINHIEDAFSPFL